MKKYKIIYDDQDLLVVCKFAGLAVQSARVSTPDLMSLLRNEMLERGEKKPYLGLVNRLDQPVEGIVLIGKNEKAAADLSRQVTDHIHMEKWYQTVVCGKPERREDTLVDYLLKDSRTNTSKVVKEGTPGSKRSELHYEVLASDGEKTLLRIRLLTGRHHQIRAQLSKIGCPIKGDLKYGAKRSNPDGGISLHSRSVTFLHPVRKEPLTVTAPVPEGDNLWAFFADAVR